MGNGLLLTLVGIAFVIFAATESHATGFAFGTENFYFQLYNGERYIYSITPYTYVSGDYYYFDYPYRVYSYGSYYNFQPGWYSFSPSFYYAPYSTAYYTYYPSSYYYYNSAWAYSPGWVASYGPAFYGNYYYPPRQATLVGSGFKAPEEAGCSEASVVAESFSIDAGDTKARTFHITNNSGKYLDIQNVSVFIDGFDAGARNVKFDREISNGGTGKITFEAFAASTAKTGSAEGKVKVYATFRDGTSCTAGEIQDSFTVSVFGADDSTPTNTIENANRYNANAFYNPQGSTSYNRAKESRQAWADVAPTASSNYNYQNLASAQTVPATNSNYAYQNISKAATRVGPAANMNNYNAPGQARDNARNVAEFAGAGDATVTTPYGKRQLPSQGCQGLGISAKNVSVGAGKESRNYFTLRNYSSEDFLVDRVQAIEYSPDFSTETYRDTPRLFAGETGVVKVNVFADDVGEDSTGSAYIVLDGHYGSGLQCKITSDNFLVQVNASERDALTKIKITVPGKVELAGTSGFVEISFENGSNKEASVTVYADNADVSPAEVVLPPHTIGKRTFAVNGFMGAEAKVVYDVKAGGIGFLQRSTKILRAKGTNDTAQKTATPVDVKATAEKGSAEEVVIPITTKTTDQNAGTGVVQKITNLAGAGFAVLGGGNAAVGIVVLLLIVTGFWVAYRVATK